MSWLPYTVCLCAFVGRAYLCSEEWPASPVIQRLSHAVSVHDSEIDILKQRIENNEAAAETMRQEVQDLLRAAKDSASDAKTAHQEKVLNKLLEDLKTLKKHSNDTAAGVSKLQQAVAAQEEVAKSQAKQIQDLEKALRSLAQVMQKPLAQAEKGVYRVKSGDSLDRIAKEHGTTVQALKERNNLQSSTIHPGQDLHIP